MVNEFAIRNTRVFDSCPIVKGNPTDNITVRLTKLKDILSSDGVHFTREGLSNLASSYVSGLRSITARATTPPGSNTKIVCFFWRGIKSPNGASKLSAVAANLARKQTQPLAKNTTATSLATQHGGSHAGSHGGGCGAGHLLRHYHLYRR